MEHEITTKEEWLSNYCAAYECGPEEAMGAFFDYDQAGFVAAKEVAPGIIRVTPDCEEPYYITKEFADEILCGWE